MDEDTKLEQRVYKGLFIFLLASLFGGCLVIGYFSRMIDSFERELSDARAWQRNTDLYTWRLQQRLAEAHSLFAECELKLKVRE